MIYFVGEAWDLTEQQARERAAAGEIDRVMRGIYVSRGADKRREMLAHAVRVAQYLYPNAYLSHASAWRLGPAPDGTLYLSGGYNRPSPLEGFTVRQFRAPRTPETRTERIIDPRGEIAVTASSLAQTALECFTPALRGPGRGLEPAAMNLLVLRLVSESGGTQAALRRCERLARANGLEAQLARLREWIELMPELAPRVEAPGRPTYVLYYGRPAAVLAWRQGQGFVYRAESEWGEALRACVNRPGALPAFLAALLPEGWLRQQLGLRAPHDVLIGDRAQRFMSNIALARQVRPNLVIDRLWAGLGRFASADGSTFTGRLVGLPQYNASFEERLGAIWREQPQAPKISGTQAKLPLSLTEEGLCVPAVSEPFSHILKLPGRDQHQGLAAAEWFGLTASRLAGIKTARALLAPLPGGPPALLVERFDIPHADEPTRRLLLEECAPAMGLGNEEKYSTSVEAVCAHVRSRVTDWNATRGGLFRMFVLSWAIGNGDLHTKNLAVLKEGDAAGAAGFTAVTLAPAYDVLCTQALPGYESDAQALPLLGKCCGWTASDLMTLGCEILGMEASDAVRHMAAAARGALAAAERATRQAPAQIAECEPAARVLMAAARIASLRAGRLLAELPVARACGGTDSAPGHGSYGPAAG